MEFQRLLEVWLLESNTPVGWVHHQDRGLLRITPSSVPGPPASVRTKMEASLISRDALPIKRHRNPLGIFSRTFIYPLIGVGAWRHRLELVVAGVALEALLWTAVPPVDETFGFVKDAIETELDWLNAPAGAQKTLSLVLLALFPIVLFAGLWRRSRRLLAMSAGLIVAFYFLMRRVAMES